MNTTYNTYNIYLSRLKNENNTDTIIKLLYDYQYFNIYPIIDILIDKVDTIILLDILKNYKLNNFLMKIINKSNLNIKPQIFSILIRNGYNFDYYYILKELEESEVLYLDIIEYHFGLDNFDYLFSIALKENMFYLLNYFLNLKDYNTILKYKDIIINECSYDLIKLYSNNEIRELLELNLEDIVNIDINKLMSSMDFIIDNCDKTILKLIIIKMDYYPESFINKLKLKFHDYLDFINDILESIENLNLNHIILDSELNYLDKFLINNNLHDIIEYIPINVLKLNLHKLIKYELDVDLLLYLNKFNNIIISDYINNKLEISKNLSVEYIKLDFKLKYLNKFLKSNDLYTLIINIPNNILNENLDEIMKYNLNNDIILYLLNNTSIDITKYINEIYINSELNSLIILLDRFKFKINDNYLIVSRIINKNIDSSDFEIKNSLIKLLFLLINDINFIFNIDTKSIIFKILSFRYLKNDKILYLTQILINKKVEWIDELILNIFNNNYLILTDIFSIYEYYNKLNYNPLLISYNLLKQNFIIKINETDNINNKIDININDKIDIINNNINDKIDININNNININNGAIFERDLCVICLENNSNIQTICNHSFHSTCLIKWLKINSNCPYCKKDF